MKIIARLFYACILPFNIADHPMWKETIGMLRPGYTPPKAIINQPTDHHNLHLTTKNIQSVTQYFNQPVLTTLGVLTGAVLTG